MQKRENADPHELHKFSESAHRWWDKNSEFKVLHEINPLRLNWIDQHALINHRRVLDVGCGGGILAESMAQRGAQVKGIDLSIAALDIAELHALETGIQLDYEAISAEALAAREPASYDVVTCMEMLEHVPDPASIVKACATLVKPGGWVFFSTIHRHLKSYVLAILGAEYLTGMLPRGTHDYARFIRPDELAAIARASGLTLIEFKGLQYRPIARCFTLSQNVDVNYLLACLREN